MHLIGVHGSTKAHGEITVADYRSGKEIHADTKQCPHCGGHWMIQPGSGRPHVYCRNCNADTCSNPACLRECYPLEKKFDDLEKHGRLILP